MRRQVIPRGVRGLRLPPLCIWIIRQLRIRLHHNERQGSLSPLSLKQTRTNAGHLTAEVVGDVVQGDRTRIFVVHVEGVWSRGDEARQAVRWVHSQNAYRGSWPSIRDHTLSDPVAGSLPLLGDGAGDSGRKMPILSCVTCAGEA